MGRHSRYQWTRLGLQPRSSDSPVHACTRPAELRRPVACRRRHTHRRRPPGCLCVPRKHPNSYPTADSYPNRATDSYRHRRGDTDTDTDTETNPDAKAAPYTGASSGTAALAARIIAVVQAITVRGPTA